MRLRLLTWNVHAGVGTDGRLDLERIAGRIAAWRPDLAALQEVDAYQVRSGEANQWRTLGRLTGLAALYGSNLTRVEPTAPDGHPGRLVRQYGNAVLTRLPVRAVENHLLTYRDEGEGYREQRGCLEVETERGVFLATHWGLHAEERRAQSLDILALAELRGPQTAILGDLNAVSISREVAPLRQRFLDAGAGAGPTSPAPRPERRIDYCFVPRTWRVIRAEVTVTEASDHAAVVVDVETGEGA